MGWISPEYGAYAAAKVIPAHVAFKIPTQINLNQAAASIMKGMTVRMLVRMVYTVKSGQTVLVHAAAGGVGQLLTQWCSQIGATVIATVGNQRKADIAKACGGTHVIDYKLENFVDRVLEITNGEGVPVVFDSVGADTVARSLQCLGNMGVLVSYGQSSGPAPAIQLSDLAFRSLSVTRPILFHYIHGSVQLDAMAAGVLNAWESGMFKPINPMQMPLAKVAEAHRLIEARKSPGGIILHPDDS